MQLFIITGISKGLGKSLLKVLCETKEIQHILGLSRTYSDVTYEGFEYINLDLKNINAFQSLRKVIEEKYNNLDCIVFINNAGTIYPIGKVSKLDEYEIIDNLNVNLISCIMLTSMLLKLTNKLKVVNISSGAADKAIVGWAPYCTAKSGVKMFFDTLEQGNEIDLLHIDPGVMDTQMQETIRNSQEEDFPNLQTFISFKENNTLKNPDIVAKDILAQLLAKKFI